MNKTLKKALSVFMAACLAVSCFAVTAFGVSATYTGYDHNGRNTALTTNYSFNVVEQDDTKLVVDVVVDHMSTYLYGFEGTLVYDKTLLEYESISYNAMFEAYEGFEPAQANLALSELKAGADGAPVTSSDFARYVGGATALSTGNLAALKIEGTPSDTFTPTEEDSTVVATLTFKVIGAGESALTALSSYLYSDAVGYYNLCGTTTADNVAFVTAYSAVAPLAYTATGSGAAVTYYDATFTYKTADGAETSEVIKVKENETPVAPSVTENFVDPEDGDYDYNFTAWSPALSAITENTVYTAQYDRTFVAADYSDYTAAVQVANEKIASGIYTDDSVAALQSVLAGNTVESDKGRTYQSTIDSAVLAINGAISNLQEKPVTSSHKITFVWTTAAGEQSVDLNVEDGVVPSVPEGAQSGYSAGDYDYTFTSWDKEIAAAVADTVYTAQYDGVFVAADFVNYNAAVAAANDELDKDIYTEATAQQLRDALLVDVSSYGRTRQADVDAQTALINTKKESLSLQYYNITFNYKGSDGSEKHESQQVVRHSAPVVPSVDSYSDGEYTYTFSKWDKAVATDTTADTVYTAEYTTASVPDADYTPWTNAVAAVPEDLDTGFKSAGVAAVKAALADAPASGLKEADQSIIDSKAQALRDAVAQLIPREDNSALKSAYDALNAYTADASVYTPSSIAAFGSAKAQALALAQTVLGNVDATASDISSAVTEIENTYKVLVEQADKTALKAAIEDAKSRDENQYTPSSWAEVESALANAESVNSDADATASQVAQATESLTTALSKLQTKADKAALYSLILQAQGMEATGYYSDLAEVEAATQAALLVYNDDNASSEAVANALSNLRTAIENAPKKPADYSNYNSAVSALRALLAKTEVYTPASVATVTDALNNIVNNLSGSITIDNQSLVDEAQASVEALGTQLVERADTTSVTEAFAAADSYNTDNYKTASVAAWREAVAALKSDFDAFTGNETAEEVAAFVQRITDSYSMLAEREDNTALKAAVADLVSYVVDADKYTPDSVAEFTAASEQAVTKAQAVINNVDATAQEIAQAITDINSVYSKLVLRADKTAFAQALVNALAKDTTSYTPDSVTAYEQEIARLQSVYDSLTGNETQAVIDGYTAEVNSAASLLIAQADKGALEALIQTARALDSSLYVDFTGVESALNQAQSVFDNSNASDSEVSSAIAALNSAITDLVFKDADYSAWNDKTEQFNSLDKTLYTASSVENVNSVIERVVLGQDINYQSTLNSLTAELTQAVADLQFQTAWSGETDWEGTVFDTFGSNIEYKIENMTQSTGSFESGDRVKVTVTLNHPNYDILAMQNAVLYDGALLKFESVSVTDGTVLYEQTGAAQFNTADYGVASMAAPTILKVGAEFNSAKPAQAGVRDEVMVIYFTVKGSSEGTTDSVITSVPLAANVAQGASDYTELYTSDGDSYYPHRTDANITIGEKVVTGVKVSGSISAVNSNIATTVTLSNSENTYTRTIAAKAGTGDFTAEYEFDEVEAGTYTLTFTKAGSLTYTVNNVTVGDGDMVIGQVDIVSGDVDGDGKITTADASLLLSNAYYLTSVDPSNVYDVNGDGSITTADVSIILSVKNYLKTEASDCTVDFGA